MSNRKDYCENSAFARKMQNMFAPVEDERIQLERLGARLRARRRARGETQANFAARIGVSAPTYRKMEAGDPGAPVGYWVRALRLLGEPDGVNGLLPVSLFDEDIADRRAHRGRQA